MKKAQMGTTVKWIIAAVFLVSLIGVFTPLIKKAIEPLQGDWFSTGKETTTETIDEERIDADTPIPINSLEYDKESGLTVIVKQEYGQGWNFEVQKTAFDTFSDQYTGPGWLFVYLMSGEEKPQPILENEKIVDILNSNKLHGKIEINGKTYIHTPSENNFCWFADTDNSAFDGETFTDEEKTGNIKCQHDEGESFTDTNNNNKYDPGEAITTEKLRQHILALLWEEAT